MPGKGQLGVTNKQAVNTKSWACNVLNQHKKKNNTWTTSTLQKWQQERAERHAQGCPLPQWGYWWNPENRPQLQQHRPGELDRGWQF